MAGTELLNLAFGAMFVGSVLWISLRKRRQNGIARDGPASETYRIFTREYDLEVTAREVATRLPSASGDYWSGWTDRDGTQRNETLRIYEAYASEFSELQLDLTIQKDVAVTFLVDQSGSMKGAPMAAVAAGLGAIADKLATSNIQLEILGYSTAGWQGGKAYQKWRLRQKPRHPGRISALLHIIYKELDDPVWRSESRQAMLNPDILRENVDGEAIKWACSRLGRSHAQKKFVVVVSDGAPVDDVTLMHNGPSYLERHLRQTILDVESRGEITLGAVGVRYDVSHYYSRFRNCELNTIPQAIANLLEDMLR